MKINALKFVYLIGITIFVLLLYCAPFVRVVPLTGEALNFTFVDFVNGRSPFVMQGAHFGAIAALPAIPLLIALFLPNYTGDKIGHKRVTVLTLCMAGAFACAVSFPLLQAAALVLKVDVVSSYVYKLEGLWGTLAVLYCALGLLIFMFLTAIPRVREGIVGTPSYE